MFRPVSILGNAILLEVSNVICQYDCSVNYCVYMAQSAHIIGILFAHPFLALVSGFALELKLQSHEAYMIENIPV